MNIGSFFRSIHASKLYDNRDLKSLETYLKTMGFKERRETENECKRKFRMGENVYLSKREITLSVRMIN